MQFGGLPQVPCATLRSAQSHESMLASVLLLITTHGWQRELHVFISLLT